MSSPEQRAKLYALEEQAEQGLVAAAKALGEIRKSKLYKLQFATWEDYCRERWAKSKRRIDQLIRAGQVAEEMGNKVSRLNSRQACALAPLAPEAKQEALRAAGDSPTAERIQELAGKALGALSPDDQVRRIRAREQQIRAEEELGKVVAGGDGAKDRLEQIRRRSKLLRKLTEGLGPEGDEALTHLDQFDQAIARIDL